MNSMDKSQIIALIINILKSISGILTINIQVLKVNSYLLCEEKFLSNLSELIKEFTLVLCKHIFHQKCLKKHLINGKAIYLNKKYNKVIKTFLFLDFFKKRKNKDKEMEIQEITKSFMDEMNINTAKVIMVETTITAN